MKGVNITTLFSPEFKTKLKVTIRSLFVAVVLFTTVVWGLGSGKTRAQAENVFATQAELVKGLNYFYADQDRFPTVLEFGERPAMLNYFNSFPPLEFAAGGCSESYVYKRDDSQNFSLSFCLPQDVDGLSKGWHTVLADGNIK